MSQKFWAIVDQDGVIALLPRNETEAAKREAWWHASERGYHYEERYKRMAANACYWFAGVRNESEFVRLQEVKLAKPMEFPQ